MPSKVRITKEAIIDASMNLVREEGANALNARGVAGRLGCSTQPIFSNYAVMEELRSDVIKAAERLYREYQERDMAKEAYPPYKASGMAYIRFAREEKELFKLLFMRDRSNEKIAERKEEIEDLIRLISRNAGLSEEEAYRFHIEMWLFVHGIAVMAATSYLEWDPETISGILTDAYEGLKARFQIRKASPFTGTTDSSMEDGKWTRPLSARKEKKEQI
ncbi:MAG: TetR/AcrR family transcriptional regulator [Lachnospiraceae bacterium]|nr:TetR/AcrR family transcriptional regulator [Lachnospiraceae bacterium]